VLARELTKLHETLLGDNLGELSARLEADPLQRKGEFVVLVAGAAVSAGQRQGEEAERVLRTLVEELPIKQAAALAARITGLPKNQLYRQALAWKRPS